jgi:perosamine synthetase
VAAQISFFDTYVAPSAAARVSEVVSSGWLSEGRRVAEFETRLAAELGLAHPVAVNSGTSALHLALVLAGVEAGDEVILPAQTFVASGLVILQVGATPVFADIDYSTGNVDPASIASKITARTKAIMPVHWGGLPVDLDAIREIAAGNGLRVVEDAAHALGATYRGTPVGATGDVACFSFQAIKHVTTGDGGAVCSPDPALAAAAKARRWFGIDRTSGGGSLLGERAYDVGELGFKYHLNDYAATLGLANLDGFHARLERRREVAMLYRQGLEGIAGVTLFAMPPDRESAWWLFGLHVERRDDFVRALASAGVPASVVHLRIDRNSVFGGIDSTLNEQRRFDETQIHIPLHDRIGRDEAEFVVDVIRKGW